MTYRSGAECQPNFREWREHIGEYNSVAELLDDLMFIQPSVWFISTAAFLGLMLV